MPGLAKTANDTAFYRAFLAIAGGVYFVWWFAVAAFLPEAVNPLPSRLAVVAFFFLALALSFVSRAARRHIERLYLVGAYLLTLHFFYLFYLNRDDPNWVIGAFITVLALSYCLFRVSALAFYSLYVIALSVALAAFAPSLHHSVFLPGIVTILLQANVSLLARARMLKRLLETNERFQLLFNSASEGVLVHEGQRILQVNEAFAQTLGYTREEILAKELFSLVHPTMAGHNGERIKPHVTGPYETVCLRKDGSGVDIEVRAKQISFDGRPVRMIMTQDLTERKRMERERVNALAMRENLRARDEFISLASHELKTPLTSLKLWNQMMDRGLRDSPLREYVRLSGRQIDRLASLIEAMLDVTEISSDRMQVERKRLNFAALVREAVAQLRPMSETYGSKVQVDTPESVMVAGDSLRLTQAVENLLTNALKYGDRKPIFVALAPEKGEAVLTVRDQGFGIDPKFFEQIFERFERVNSEKNISGLGLGLYVTRKIIRAHGGTVSVTSAPEQGSTFTVRLPLEGA